jgi:hypothetical protein
MRISRVIPILLILLAASCSRPVIRQPVAEIDRPLFLPPNNWQFSSGVGIARSVYPSYYNYKPELYWYPILDFQFPSFRIGNHVEYQIPAALRYYIIKNTAIVDSTECISGLNIALSSSLDGFSYGQYYGLRVPTSHRLLLKTPLSKLIWFQSGLAFLIDLPFGAWWANSHGWNLELPFILGFQPAKRVSLTAGALLHEEYWYFEWENSGWNNVTREYDLNLIFPVTARYAFNRNWDLTVEGQCTIFDRQHFNFFGGLVGSFTW